MITLPALDETHASWRDLYEVHPCADVFPMMSDKEIDKLAKDISANGLREAVVLWRGDADHPDRICILDGRNRLAALERLNVTFMRTGLDAMFPDGQTKNVFRWSDTSDPAAYVISTNIRRRHLTKTQQSKLIYRAVEAAKNDAANMARSFSPTPGQRGGSSKDPVLHAAVQEGEKHGISKWTMQRAGRTVRGGSRSPKKKRLNGSGTPTGEATSTETSAPTTTTAASRKIQRLLHEVESLIQKTERRWPAGSSLQTLVDFLRSEAARLATREEGTP